MKYQVAYTAYQACVRAVTEATMSGAAPAPTLLANEAKALVTLTELRGKLMAAMAEDNEAAAPRHPQR